MNNNIKKVLILFIIMESGLLSAQNIDYNAIILPGYVDDISFPEKLVRLAWQNNPAADILDYEAEVAELEVKQARWSWLDGFGIQGNINEFTLNPSLDVGNRSAFYPKYNMYAQVRLNYFVGIPLEVRKKKQNTQIARSNINLQKLTLRAEVLRRYETYYMNRELLKVQTQIVEDLRATVSLAEQQFKNGEITLEAYNQELDRYNNERVNQIKTQGDFNISKIELEEIIGVKLEDVL